MTEDMERWPDRFHNGTSPVKVTENKEGRDGLASNIMETMDSS